MLFYGISLIMKEKSNASALVQNGAEKTRTWLAREGGVVRHRHAICLSNKLFEQNNEIAGDVRMRKRRNSLCCTVCFRYLCLVIK